MAYKMFTKETGSGRVSTRVALLLNSFAVGPGRPNRRDDVLLVQFFLKKLSSFQLLGGTQNPQKMMQVMAFAVDGIAGPITFQWIRDFQKNSPIGLFADGIIDAPPASVAGDVQMSSSISQTTYTIIAMNMLAWGFCGGPFNVEQDPEFPAELRMAILRSPPGPAGSQAPSRA